MILKKSATGTAYLRDCCDPDTLLEQEDGLADTIRFCTENNIRVSVGHTAATPEQIRRAAELGATMSTHLGNGCEIQMHRHNNPIWAQLAEDSLWSGIITDGFHLPPSLIKVILRAKQGKILLTSDTTAFGGMARAVITPISAVMWC